MQTIGKKILIRKESYPEKKGLIYIPQTHEDNPPPYVGIIESVGNKCTDLDLVVGTRVTYHWSSGIPVMVNDVQYIIVEEEAITGVLDKNVVVS